MLQALLQQLIPADGVNEHGTIDAIDCVSRDALLLQKVSVDSVPLDWIFSFRLQDHAGDIEVLGISQRFVDPRLQHLRTHRCLVLDSRLELVFKTDLRLNRIDAEVSVLHPRAVVPSVLAAATSEAASEFRGHHVDVYESFERCVILALDLWQLKSTKLFVLVPFRLSPVRKVIGAVVEEVVEVGSVSNLERCMFSDTNWNPGVNGCSMSINRSRVVVEAFFENKVLGPHTELH